MSNMPGKIVFNETSLFNLQGPESEYADYWDQKTTGLFIRVYAPKKDGTTRKVFYFRKYDGQARKSHRLKLGEFPALNISEARRLALEMSEKYEKGENVFEGVHSFSQLFEKYGEYASLHTKTYEKNTKGLYDRRLRELWGERPLTEIRPKDVQSWVNEVGRKHPATANRALSVLKAALQWGITQGYVTGNNPCLGVKGFKVQRRKRFLSTGEEGEFEKFKAVLNSYYDETIRDFFWLCYYTGARKSNVLKMQWVELDLENGYWHIPMTKNGDAHTVALSETAIELLRERRRKTEETVQWVFPARRKGKNGTPHLADPKKGFNAKIKAAGIKDFKIHDIRHTTASHMVINNVSLEIVGEQLGHRSIASTKIYAHLAKEVLREAINKSLQR